MLMLVSAGIFFNPAVRFTSQEHAMLVTPGSEKHNIHKNPLYTAHFIKQLRSIQKILSNLRFDYSLKI